LIFSTTVFLFLFLPAFLGVYYVLPFRYRSGWILLGSWVFYGWWRLDFLGLIIATTIWTYLLGKRIAHTRTERPVCAGRAVTAGVVLNLGILGYFKYFNFGVDSLNTVLEAAGLSGFSVWNVILPIGISFYVFQATSYLIDVYRNDAPEAASYVDLAAYICLFPQLIAGPILRYKDLADQFRYREHRFVTFSEGALRFMTGFCKKVLIADAVAGIVETTFSLSRPGLVGAWLGAGAYTVQLYFDFSGYSDMAVGLGLMMGFRFMENFNHPYISRSITEFWRRWHISLSSWLRDYLYIPLGGNRKGQRRTYINVFLVMLLGGLWHGAAWTFVIWGAWHGSILVLERYAASRKADQKKPVEQVSQNALRHGPTQRISAAWAVPRTFLLVILGWVVFRAPDFSTAWSMYRGMLGLDGPGPVRDLVWQVGSVSLATMIIGFLIIFVAPWIKNRESLTRAPAPVTASIGVVALFSLAVLKLAAESYSPFLYFQF
jgi:alginate O-acetyltransferase complex protein AlgI